MTDVTYEACLFISWYALNWLQYSGMTESLKISVTKIWNEKIFLGIWEEDVIVLMIGQSLFYLFIVNYYSIKTKGNINC